MSFDLPVRRVFGVSGSGESGSLKASTVRGQSVAAKNQRVRIQIGWDITSSYLIKIWLSL